MVEYTWETARVRLYLPSMGETWFFVDDQTSVKEFTEQVVNEDKTITEFKVLDSQKKEITASEYSVFDILSTSHDQFYLQINNTLHTVEGVPKKAPYNLEDLAWFKKCQSKGLTGTHSTTIASFLS